MIIILIINLNLSEVYSKNNKSGYTNVKGYFKKDGTYVMPHFKTAPDNSKFNNWSSKYNTNPFTGKAGTKDPYKIDYKLYSPTNSNNNNFSNYPSKSTNNISDFSSYSNNYYNDYKTKNIERAKYWSNKGYDFNPNTMSAYMMDLKVKDIERAKYWSNKGYDFNPNTMSAYMMDLKVKDIERSKYWLKRGYNFDPNTTSSYMMDMKAKEFEKIKIISNSK